MLDILVDDHIYTTDFFQISTFNSQHQIISVYYSVKLKVEVDLMKYFQEINIRENENCLQINEKKKFISDCIILKSEIIFTGKLPGEVNVMECS